MKSKIVSIICIITTMLMLVGCSKESNEVQSIQTEKVVSVESIETIKEDITLSTILTARVTPFQEATIVPKIPGKVDVVYVQLGDKVKKGQELFALDAKDILNQVKQAEAAYKLMEANLRSSKKQLDNAMLNLERMQQLYEAGAIAKQQLEQAELQASTVNLDILEAQAEQARVSLEIASSSLADMVIKAPIDGYITSINVKPGEMASNAMPSITMANIDKVIIEATVSEYLVNTLKPGGIVNVKIPSATNEILAGKISNFSPTTAPNSLTYPVKIELQNEDGLIKGGMFAEVIIETERRSEVIAIPSDSVVIKEGKTIVFVVEEDRVSIKEVKTGLDDGKKVEILEGLNEGEEIVSSGQNFLEDGQLINVVNGGNK